MAWAAFFPPPRHRLGIDLVPIDRGHSRRFDLGFCGRGLVDGAELYTEAGGEDIDIADSDARLADEKTTDCGLRNLHFP